MSGFMVTMVVLGAALLGLAAAVPAPANFKVHEQMTAKEIRDFFQTEPHEVPEYEVIALQWPRLQKRAGEIATHIRLNAFGRNVPLWLQPIDGILAGYDTPVFKARVNQGRVRFNKIRDPMTVVGQILEDKDRKATLILTKSANGRKLVYGNIGSENWTIRQLPTRFHNRNLRRNRRSVDDFDNVTNSTIVEFDEPHYHVIYKNPKVPEGTKYASLPIDDDLLNDQTSRSKRAPVNTPSVVYPQILVVVDHATYKHHEKHTDGMLEYLLTFWNGVDLRYRGLEYPKVRLNIAGIIIEADPNALSYINKNRVTTEKINIDDALKSSGVFRREIESIFPLDNTDIMVTMTPYGMCRTWETDCEAETRGLAYVGGACKNRESIDPKMTMSVMVIRDKGGFDGVDTAAHELGHLFGAEHDGNDEGVACPEYKGYIMAPSPVLTENSGDWSQCSLNSFDIFFNKNPHGSVCLFNKPRSTSPMPRVLPGTLLTMDEQCLKIEGTKTCHRDRTFPSEVLIQWEKELCQSLKCLDTTGEYCKSVGHVPADGSICGEGMICLHGECLRYADLI